MTKTEFTTELRDGTRELGFRKGERVVVNGRLGIVHTKLVRGPNNILQSVKFDTADEDGKYFASFPHTALELAPEVEGKPSEVDLLGHRIRRT